MVAEEAASAAAAAETVRAEPLEPPLPEQRAEGHGPPPHIQAADPPQKAVGPKVVSPPWTLPPMPDFDRSAGSWVAVDCDAAYPEKASIYVAAPLETSEPAPVLLFISGNGHINDREDFLEGGVDLLLRNPSIRRKFCVVAPKPTTASGLVAYTSRSWRLEWSVDAVWAVFTAVLRSLGSDKVDVSRLYVTGISLGAAAVWHLAIKYGQHLAAAVPIGGRCAWPDNTWPPRQPLPDNPVRDRLRGLPLRAYQIDIDTRAGTPKPDMEWLTRGVEESSSVVSLPGMEPDTLIEVTIQSWKSPQVSAEGSEARNGSRDALWELWLAKGPLQDWSWWNHRGGDSHVLWWRVYTKEEWGLADFLLRHRAHADHLWSFADEPLVVNTSDQKRKLEEEWEAHKATKLGQN